MSGLTMYELKPIITRTKSTQRKAETSRMYGMKNIHTRGWSPTTTLTAAEAAPACDDVRKPNSPIVANVSEQIPLPEVAALEARQEKILAQLTELKEQVLSLCKVFESNNASAATSKRESLGERIRVDVVVRADPLRPCWAILGLKKIFPDIELTIEPHTHSSVRTEVPEFSISSKGKSPHSVNVCLIWKEVEDTEVIVSGVGYPIIGETNFLRYLVRQFSPKRYEPKSSEYHETSTLDCILDLAHSLHYREGPKDLQSSFAAISDKLGKKKWFSDKDSAGMADLAVWSAMKRASASTKLPSSLAGWYDRCEKNFLK